MIENDGKVAMLIAGYTAEDTRNAATVVANAADYKGTLKGTEVEVTKTTAGAYEVGAVTAAPVAAAEPATTTT